MVCALDKSQLRKRCCCFKELHKDVVSHHMWQNQEDGKKLWMLVKERKDHMVAKEAALRTSACLGM